MIIFSNDINLIISNIEYDEIGPTSGCVLIYNGCYFRVGNHLEIAIKTLKSGGDITKEPLLSNIEEEQLKAFMEKSLIEIDKESHRQSFSILENVYAQINLLKGGIISKITGPFQVLFKSNMALFIIAAAVLSIAVVLYYDVLLFPSDLNDVAFETLFIVYVSVFLIALFHEIGHAMASCYFGIKPKEIAFGFFMIFPVLLTDITKIWTLSKEKRIIVNLGGVYFQMLISLLIGVVLLSINMGISVRHILSIVFIQNLFLLLFSLNPFFKNDGYWIYSDYFDIPNLSHKSTIYLKNIHKVKFQNIKKEAPILFYTLGYILSLALVLFLFIRMSVYNFYFISELITFKTISWADVPLKRVLYMVLNLVPIYFLIKRLIRKAIHKV